MEQIHGGDIYRNPGVTDYSVNSNPLGMPEEAAESLRNSIMEAEHYPDIFCTSLRQAIGEFEQVDPEQILCGNGAAELFFAAALALKPEKVLLPVPSFSEYERALAAAGAEIQYYPLLPQQEFTVTEDILDAIEEDLDLVILCNPNNPTGQPVERDLINQILEKCRVFHIHLMLDECFVDFLEEPARYRMTGRIADAPELLIVKAFTKTFCMPGLRLGYALCGDRSLLEKMASYLQPWNVSVPAQTAGTAALRNSGVYLEKTRAYLQKERRKLMQALRNAGLRVYGSQANYLFFEGPKGLYRQALDAGLLIRDCGNYRGLSEGYYRIAVRRQEENERFIEWLRKL